MTRWAPAESVDGEGGTHPWRVSRPHHDPNMGHDHLRNKRGKVMWYKSKASARRAADLQNAAEAEDARMRA